MFLCSYPKWEHGNNNRWACRQISVTLILTAMPSAAISADAVRPNKIRGGYARGYAGRVLRGRGSARAGKKFGARRALGAPIGLVEGARAGSAQMDRTHAFPPFFAVSHGVVAWRFVAWMHQGTEFASILMAGRLMANLTTPRLRAIGTGGASVVQARPVGGLPPHRGPRRVTHPRRAGRSQHLRIAIGGSSDPVGSLRPLAACAPVPGGANVSAMQMGSGVRARARRCGRISGGPQILREAMGQGATGCLSARGGTGLAKLWRGGEYVNAAV